jgi:hypothetical protein
MSPFTKRRGGVATTLNLNMAGVSVMIGIPAGRDLPIQTVKSLIGTFAACSERGVPCQLGAIANSAVIQWARDEVADLFLKSDASVLFWIDSDMEWEPGHFIRLLIWSQVYDVVCAAYPAKIDRPTFYLQDEGGKPDSHGLRPIKGIGMGFVAMRRSVVERLAEKAPRVRDEISQRDIAAIFRVDSIDGHRRGEDMAFFADIKALGCSVMLDPSIDLGHVGQKVYRGSIRDAMK